MIEDQLEYDPATGVIRWKKSKPGVTAGTIAGTVLPIGYRSIHVDGKFYYAHRLAFFFMTGAFPENGMKVDHINGQTDDNRWGNLRLVTQSGNGHNRQKLNKNNTSGIAGVRFYKNGWVASLKVNRKEMYLGRFKTKEEAIEAREAARRPVLESLND